MNEEFCRGCKSLTTRPHIKRFCEWKQMACKLVKDCHTSGRNKTPEMERKRRIKRDRQKDRERLAKLDINKDKKRSAGRHK